MKDNRCSKRLSNCDFFFYPLFCLRITHPCYFVLFQFVTHLLNWFRLQFFLSVIISFYSFVQLFLFLNPHPFLFLLHIICFSKSVQKKLDSQGRYIYFSNDLVRNMALNKIIFIFKLNHRWLEIFLQNKWIRLK